MHLGPRRFLVLFVLGLAGGLTIASVPLVGSGTASAAVDGSKARITTRSCSSTTCQITLTIVGVVKETPTGQVDFLLAGSAVPSTDDSCVAAPMIPINGSSARATCDASGLPQGRDRITASYSGDRNFDPSDTSKRIRVKNPSTI